MPPTIRPVTLPSNTVEDLRPRRSADLRRRVRVGHVAAAALLLTVIGLIGPALLGQGSFGGADYLLNFDPWRATAETGVDITRAPVSDIVDARLPRQQQWGASVRDGDLALWNPFAVGGTGQHVDAFAPTELPYAALPAQRATAWVALLGVLTGAVGSVLFLRRIGLSLLAAVAGATIYTFSGFQVAWALWPQSHVGAVVPLLFWAIERHVQKPDSRSVAAMAATTGWLLLEGFPAVAAVALGGAAVYGLLRTVLEHPTRSARTRVLITAAVAGVLGVAIAAVALLPLGALLQRAEISRDSLAGVNSDMAESIALVSPDTFGGPDAPHRGATNAIETASFVGAGALLLAALAFGRRGLTARRGVQGMFGIAAVVLALLVFVDGVHVDLAAKLPVLDFNPLTRLRGLLAFAIAVTAAIGLDGARRRSSWDARRVAGLAVGGVLAVGLVVRTVSRYPDPADAIHLSDALLRPAAVSVAVLALVALMVWRPRYSAAAALAITAVLLVDGASFASGWWRTTDDAAFYPATPTHDLLDEQLDGDRFAGTGGSLWSGTGTFYGHREATGNAGHTAAWAELLRAVDPAVFLTTTYTRLAPTPAVIESPILDRLAVRFVSYPVGVVVGSPVDPPPASSSIAFGAGPGVRMPWPGPGTGAVVVDLQAGLFSEDPVATLVAEVVTDDGTVVAEGHRRLFGGLAAGLITIPVTTPPDDTASLEVTLRLEATDATLVQLGADDTGTAVTGSVTLPPETRVVVADGATLVERLTALPRIRWNGRSAVAIDGDRLDQLRAGVATDTVVLSEPGPTATGSTAEVTVVEDGPERIIVDIDADGPGYVVVADAIDGWSATIDGSEVPLVDADHAMVAVWVDGGSHRVEISNDRGPFHLGLTITLIAVLITAALALRGAERSRVARGTLLAAGIAALIAIAVASWNSIDPQPDQLAVGPLLILGLVVAFSYLVVSAEFHLAGRALGVPIDPGTALMTTTIATAANMLPLPGAVVTRVVVLTRGGASTMASVRVLAAIGGLWLGVAMIIAGFGVAPHRPAIAAGMVVVGIAAIAVGAILLRRFGADRSTVGLLLLTEAAMTALGAVRLWLALESLGLSGSVAEIISVGVSAPLSAAVGIVPAGIGVREAIAVVLGSLSGLGGAEAGVASAVDRAVGLAALAPAVLLATIIRRRNRDVNATAPESASERETTSAP